MRDSRVLVVEDDAGVADLHRRVLQATRGFSVAGIARTAELARELLPRLQPDLILLDLGLPGMDGISFLRQLRQAPEPIEVIAVTAARGTSDVRAAVQLGVIDYLVKPFTVERFRQALALYLHRSTALHAGTLEQAEVDVICASGRRTRRLLPKGLTPQTLAHVRTALGQAESSLSAEQVAARIGAARVTARRYLDYLAATGEASVASRRHGPGRPTKVYRRVAN
jgi:response regulator of citrate/malate metabolism